MSEREWYPADWVDESCPPSKPRPEDFVLVDGDSYQLGYEPGDKRILDDEREIFNQQLAAGDIVHFMCCDRFDDVDVTVTRCGHHTVHGAIPPEHNWVTVQGDMDTLRDSFDEILKAIFDPRGDLHSSVFDDGESEALITLMFARWSDSLPHQFSIEDGKPMFRQVPAATVSN